MINEGYALLVNRAPDVDNPAPWERYIPQTFRPIVLPDWLEATRRLLVGRSTDWWDVTYRAEIVLSVLLDPWRRNLKFWMDTRTTEPPVYPMEYYADPVTVATISATGTAQLAPFMESSRRNKSVPVQETWVARYAGSSQFFIKHTGTGSTFTRVMVGDRVTFGDGLAFAVSGVPAVGDTWRFTVFTRPANILGKLYVTVGALPEDVSAYLFSDNSADFELYEYGRLYRTSIDPADRVDAVASAYLYRARTYLSA